MYWGRPIKWWVQMSFSVDEGHLVHFTVLRGMSPFKKVWWPANYGNASARTILHSRILPLLKLCITADLPITIFRSCNLNNWPPRMCASSSVSQIIILSILIHIFCRLYRQPHLYELLPYSNPFWPHVTLITFPLISNSYSPDPSFTSIILSGQLRSLHVNELYWVNDLFYSVPRFVEGGEWSQHTESRKQEHS